MKSYKVGLTSKLNLADASHEILPAIAQKFLKFLLLDIECKESVFLHTQTLD